MTTRRKNANAHVHKLLADRARDPLFDITSDLPRVIEIDIEKILPNPDQPRRQIDQGSIAELAQSIAQHGLLQPIIVKEEGDNYILVAGQRRMLAHQHLGRDRITALLTTGRPDELALIENLQRQDLPPLDEAEALAALKERYGYTQEELASALAKAKSTISELLSLNTLPGTLKSEIRQRNEPISKSLLIEIARLEDERAQLDLWERLGGMNHITVRAIRAAKRPTAKRSTENGTKAAATAVKQLLTRLESAERSGAIYEPQLQQMLLHLRDRIDSLVGIDNAGANRVHETNHKQE